MSCPEGYTLRKGYTRKFSKSIKSNGFTVRRKGTVYTVRPKANTVQVDASCVKKRNSKPGIGKLRKGELIKYGYQYRLSDANRRKALEKAISQYGAVSVYRKLNAVAKLSVTSAPEASTIFSKDRNWVHSKFKK
jgi:hypothetical protein